ncbi:flagellar type III secretion system protein FliR [Paenibacillus albiflavus]|uniref:Flagellar biosynthetic protein FliR n=1 Tax=Paenibacillus albiflavus TaxID=2545760 RepID=A0A4R4ENH3_9BACL|nr:flagellar biosynthetic protein FliR [Paenibacillus albiflavus]TCZ79975.1 flagellar type III secretion system protein FliR [Paenibacillus albiflavus]
MDQYIPYVSIFLLILCRISAFFVVAPIFSARNVPVMLKIGLAALISFIAFATVGTELQIEMNAMYIMYVIREVLVGLMLGFLAYMFFTVVQIAGSLIDFQIGFGISNVIDPMSGTAAPVIGNFKFMLATLLFLALDGHHLFIKGMLESFNWIPLTNELFAKIYDGQVSTFIADSFVNVFALAFQLAAPVLVSLFLTDLGLGLLTRVAPQFNVFVVGIPVKLLVGLIMILVLLSSMSSLFQDVFIQMLRAMEKLMHIIAGEVQ